MIEDGRAHGVSAPLTSNHVLTTDHHFFEHLLCAGHCSGHWGQEGEFKRDKRYSPIPQAAGNLIWELKPTQIIWYKNTNKHFARMGMRKKVLAFFHVKRTEDFAHEMIT